MSIVLLIVLFGLVHSSARYIRALPSDGRIDVSTILLETANHTVRTTPASCFHGYGTVRCLRGRKWKTTSRRALLHRPCREMKRRHAKSHRSALSTGSLSLPRINATFAVSTLQERIPCSARSRRSSPSSNSSAPLRSSKPCTRA